MAQGQNAQIDIFLLLNNNNKLKKFKEIKCERRILKKTIVKICQLVLECKIK